MNTNKKHERGVNKSDNDDASGGASAGGGTVPLSKLTWEGILVATSSIHQGGESLGYTSYLRRERYHTESGFLDIPTISGNSLRGVLRTIAAGLWWDAVGQPLMTTAVAHAIWSGGSLAKNSTHNLTGMNLLEVLEACPVVEIFGTAGGGRIIDGKLSVSKLVPLVEQTKPYIPKPYQKFCTHSVWDYLQMESYSRKGINETNTHITHERKDVEANSPGNDVGEGRMRYQVESFTAGTKFHFKVSTQRLSEAGLVLLLETMRKFTEEGHVGGRSSVGFGSFALNLDKEPQGLHSQDLIKVLARLTKSETQERLARLN